MKLLNTVVATLVLGACASSETARRPAATAQTEPAPRRHHEHGGGVQPVEPEHIADAPRADGEHRFEAPAARPNDNNTQALDRDDAVTPMDQGNHAADLEITRKIRGAVTSDDSLSFAAKNVKIVTVAGDVTLRGTVHSDTERKTIETYSRQVVGAGHVRNQLEVERQ